MKKILLLGYMLLFINVLRAQTWEQIYGHNFGSSQGFEVQETLDGGFIIVGDIDYPTGAIRHYIRLIKTDDKGLEEWSKIYYDGDVLMEEGLAVQQDLIDSTYVISGTTSQNPTFNTSILLMKVDINGDTIWTRQYGSYGLDNHGVVRKTQDGNWILLGNVEIGLGIPILTQYPFLAKINTNGDTLWTKHQVGNNFFRSTDMIEIYDDSYIIVGSGTGDAHVVRTDSIGNTIWHYMDTGSNSNGFLSVDVTVDSSIIVSGSVAGFAGNSPTITKLDKNGTLKWTSYPWSLGEANDVMVTSDGYILVTGFSTMPSGQNSVVKVAKLTMNGNIIWENTVNDTLFNAVGNSIIETQDGNYVIGGTAQSNIYLVKMDTSGVLLNTTTYPMKNEVNATIQGFPNPITDNLYIKVQNPEFLDLDLQIYNTEGKLIQKIDINPTLSKTEIIKTHHWTAGIYLIQLCYKGNIIITQKVIKP